MRGRTGPGTGVMELLGIPIRAGTARGPALLWPPVGPAPTATAGRILCLDTLPPDTGPAPGPGWVGGVLRRTERPDSAGGPPLVGGLAPSVFRDADPLEVDGGTGRVRLAGVTEVRVVTSFLERADGRVLLLRRSDRVGSFQGRWAGVSGFLEDPTPLDQAVREIAEETGIARPDLDLRAAGPLLYAREGDRVYAVAPFRFRTRTTEIRLDWEHTECAWVDPDEIPGRATVPRLDETWAAVAPAARRDRRPNP